MSQKTWSFGILVALAAMVTCLAVPALAQETIKIGFFAPITGPAAADGASAQHAVELATKEVNAAGGIKGKKVELIVYDDRFSPQEAVAIANKLIEKDQVTGVVCLLARWTLGSLPTSRGGA